MNKAPILAKNSDPIGEYNPGFEKIATAQRDADHEFYQARIRELRGPIRREMLQELADYLNRKYFNDGCGVSKAYSRTARYSVAKDLLLEIVLLREAQGG